MKVVAGAKKALGISLEPARVVVRVAHQVYVQFCRMPATSCPPVLSRLHLAGITRTTRTPACSSMHASSTPGDICVPHGVALSGHLFGQTPLPCTEQGVLPRQVLRNLQLVNVIGTWDPCLCFQLNTLADECLTIVRPLFHSTCRVALTASISSADRRWYRRPCPRYACRCCGTADRWLWLTRIRLNRQRPNASINAHSALRLHPGCDASHLRGFDFTATRAWSNSTHDSSAHPI